VTRPGERRFCPHCGYNFEQDATLELGDWRLSPRVGVFFRGKCVTKRETWTQLLLAMADAGGEIVSSDALLNRTSGSENPNVVAVQLSRLRRHLEAAGIPIPFTSQKGRGLTGYRWLEAA
jgi:DNA-binding response OmpR family regulator